MKKILINKIIKQVKDHSRVLIDGTNHIMGRLLSRLNSFKKPVVVVNTEKMILTGTKKYLFLKYKTRIESGNKHKGPFIPTTPDRLVKRIYRGMCNYRNKNSPYHNCYFFIGALSQQEVPKYNNKISRRIVMSPNMSVGELCSSLRGSKKYDKS